jgi:hypothetical protein
MIFLHPIADLESVENKKNMKTFKDHLESGKQIFLFLYMDGCGPCNMTKTSWKDIKKHVNKDHLKNKNVCVAEINKNLFGEIENIGSDPMGYPTLRYINNNGKIIEEYESGRSPEAFAQWIESKLHKTVVHHRQYPVPHNQHSKHPHTRHTKHHSRGKHHASGMYGGMYGGKRKRIRRRTKRTRKTRRNKTRKTRRTSK